MRELAERLKIISHCPVKVFIASYIPRYWYPYRLQHAGKARSWVKDESLEVIIDSAIMEDDIGNAETLDKAHELNADYIIPNDTLHDQAATTAAVWEFMDLYERHPCRATPLIPLQPPYDEHYQAVSGFSHYVLGGIAASRPDVQLREIQKFRDVAGQQVYAHGLGLGASLTLIKALRANPRLLNSLDLSTPEKVIRGEKLPDKTWQQRPFAYPTGDESSTVRSQFASAVALQLNYMLGPFCTDDVLDDAFEQSKLPGMVPATDGGSTSTVEQ